MKPLEHLLDCYERWRRLTETEAAALQAEDWSAAARCQETKAGLKLGILAATEAAQCSAVLSHSAGTAAARELRAALQSLIDLETANAEIVAAQRDRCQRRQRELHLISRNLGRVHRTYGAGPAPLWQSYS